MSGIVDLVQSVCTAFGSVLGNIPFFGESLAGLVSSICQQILNLLNAFGGGGGA